MTDRCERDECQHPLHVGAMNYCSDCRNTVCDECWGFGPMDVAHCCRECWVEQKKENGW